MQLNTMINKILRILLLLVAICICGVKGFSNPTTFKSSIISDASSSSSSSSLCKKSSSTPLFMSNGDGGDEEWMKALSEASGKSPGDFEKAAKMKGLLGNKGGKSEGRLSANAALVQWLESEGDVYLKEASGWFEAPHPMAISTDTRDEITNESSGRGLLARRDIKDGDELLKIPLSLCVTKTSAREAFPMLKEDINEFLAVACQLIREKYVLKEKSYFKAYVAVLPETEEVNPTFTWDDADLAFLEGSPVVAATRSMQNKLRFEYDALLGNEQTGLIERYPDQFPKEAFTFDNWEWAFTMMFSRAIRLRSLTSGEALAMVPYADLINHSPFSQAYIDARSPSEWMIETGDEVILFADRSYRHMEQIYISYGPKSNADLLLLYGFAVERNPFNSVDVTVGIAPRTESFVKEIAEDNTLEVDPLAEEKLAFLESVGRNKMVEFPVYNDRYPLELLQYLRLMQMTPEDARGKRLSDFDYARSISLANEAAALCSVVTAVQRQISNYPQTEVQDADMIRDKGLFRLLTYNQRKAVRHRRNEKRLLKRTVAALEKQIARQGLDAEQLERAEGSTLGKLLPGDEKLYGMKQRTALEDRLEKMGLPIDLR